MMFENARVTDGMTAFMYRSGPIHPVVNFLLCWVDSTCPTKAMGDRRAQGDVSAWGVIHPKMFGTWGHINLHLIGQSQGEGKVMPLI